MIFAVLFRRLCRKIDVYNDMKYIKLHDEYLSKRFDKSKIFIFTYVLYAVAGIASIYYLMKLNFMPNLPLSTFSLAIILIMVIVGLYNFKMKWFLLFYYYTDEIVTLSVSFLTSLMVFDFFDLTKGYEVVFGYDNLIFTYLAFEYYGATKYLVLRRMSFEWKRRTFKNIDDAVSKEKEALGYVFWISFALFPLTSTFGRTAPIMDILFGPLFIIFMIMMIGGMLVRGYMFYGYTYVHYQDKIDLGFWNYSVFNEEIFKKNDE